MFKYSEDKKPIAIFIALFVLDVMCYVLVDNVWVLCTWMLLGLIPKGFISAWNHHHQHCYTFASPLANRLLELVYFFQTGACGYGWELHHVVGHHAEYLDQQKDPSRWKTRAGRPMGEIEYTLITTATAYPRVFVLGLKYPKLFTRFLITAVTVLTLLGLLIYWRPIPALLLFVIPPISSLLITVWTTYAHHSGLDTSDPYAASRNILDPLYNKLTGNLGYHTAHHVRCALHWSRLPEFHAQISERIPAQCYYEPGGALAFFRKRRAVHQQQPTPSHINTSDTQ